jgi:Double zinc ribbon
MASYVDQDLSLDGGPPAENSGRLTRFGRAHFGSAPPVICSSCGMENKPGRKFCTRCAAPLGLACPKYGAAYDPGALFCGECASPLTTDATAASGIGVAQAGTAAPAQAARSPVAERRLVSVLFADLVGSRRSPRATTPRTSSPRAPARRALAEAGYARLEQLTHVTKAELGQLHGMGPKGPEAVA